MPAAEGCRSRRSTGRHRCFNRATESWLPPGSTGNGCDPRGGTEAAKMIHYEAAAGAEVVVSGSRIVKTTWNRSNRNGNDREEGIWTTELPGELFAGENPFREVNLTDEQIDRGMDWAIPIKGKVPNTLRRGLVFQDGNRLQQVARYEDLAKLSGAYWVENDGLTLDVRPLGGSDPNRASSR